MLQTKRHALLWLVLSIGAAAVWPVSGIRAYLHLWAPFTWFACLGMVVLSYGRVRGIEHAIPCPELLFLVSTIIPGVLFSAFLPSSRIPAVDQFLWKFDANYGWLELAIARFFRGHLGLALVCIAVYFALPLAGTLLYLELPEKRLRQKYCVASALGFSLILCYRLCPAAGPGFLLRGSFPFSVPEVAAPRVQILQNVMLNAIPSGHVAWALTILLFAGRYCRRRVRAGAALFTLLTGFATLGLGQHYVIDLVLAVPFALCSWLWIHRHWRAGSIAMLLVLSWLVLLRRGAALEFSAPLVWILTAMTVAPLALYKYEARPGVVRAVAVRLQRLAHI